MRKRLIVFVICIVQTFGVFAQTDEFRAAYEEFKKQVQGEYEDFRAKANREYAEFVKKAWQEYKTLPAVPKPKDDTVPPIIIKDEDKKTIEDKPVVIEDNITFPEPTPQPKPVAPIREQSQPTEKYLAFSIYGTEMKVRADDGLRFSLANTDGESIAAAWERLSSGDLII